MTLPTEHYNGSQGLQWSVIFAGSAVAFAISIVLVQFGSMIGLSADGSLLERGSSVSWVAIAIGVWMLWVQLLSSLAGGYIAGYMRSSTTALSAYENEIRDGIYGLTVWAISTIGVAIFLSVGAAVAAFLEANTPGDQIVNVLSDKQENIAIVFAFATGSTSLLSAVAAWWASVKGGDHRDRKVDFSKQLSFK